MPVNPIQPQLPNTPSYLYGLQALQQGFAQLARNRQIRDQLDQQFENMRLNEAFRRDQLAQQKELQNAQIENLNAEANYRNAMAHYYERDKGQQIEDLTKAVKRWSAIPVTDRGTQAGNDALASIEADFPNLGTTPRGKDFLNRIYRINQQATQNNVRIGGVLDNNVKQALRNIGISENDFNAYQTDEKGNFVPNAVWGKSASGTPFITLDPSGNVIPPDIVKATSLQDQTAAKWFRAGITPAQVNDIRNKIRDRNQFISRLTQPSAPETGQDVTGATATAVTPSPTIDVDKANQIKSQLAAGQITPEEAVNALKGLGYGD